MATFAAEGIILRRSNFGEADRLVTIYTDRYGKIRVVAKGVRRPAAKLAGSLELFCRSKLRFAEGKNLDLVIESSPIEFYQGIRDDLTCFHLASYLAELVDKTSHDLQEHRGVYRLLVENFEALNSRQPPSILVDYFILRLLKELGYEPVVEACAVGHEKLESGKNYWSSAHGGVVCDSHRSSADRSVSIRDNVIKVIRLILTRTLAQLVTLKFSNDIDRELRRITTDFFQYHFDVTLRSQRFIDKI